MPERLLVVSDLHIAPSGLMPASFRSGDALAAFLADAARPGTTLVLAGDIVDFLQVDDRPGKLDMPGAPALMRRTLAAIRGEPWGSAILDALAAILRERGRVVLLPGNHDPELHHPDTRAVFLEAMGLREHEGFTLHTDDAPWVTEIAGRRVIVGHGHRTDGWNDIDP
jgi:UDP-2,3-diacylglucosamine pyrophosphatase LpxH